MKQGNFFFATKRSGKGFVYESKHGYIMELDGVTFGLFHETKPSAWVIVEMSTALMVKRVTGTLKAAESDARRMVKAVKQLLQLDVNKQHQERLKEFLKLGG